jgi:hypothetical protein
MTTQASLLTIDALFTVSSVISAVLLAFINKEDQGNQGKQANEFCKTIHLFYFSKYVIILIFQAIFWLLYFVHKNDYRNQVSSRLVISLFLLPISILSGFLPVSFGFLWSPFVSTVCYGGINAYPILFFIWEFLFFVRLWLCFRNAPHLPVLSGIFPSFVLLLDDPAMHRSVVIARLQTRPVLETETERQCPICITNFMLAESIVQLPCLHLYHDHCISPWFQTHTTCPLCRHDLV